MDSQDVEKDKQLARDMEIFKIITEHFRQDIREFWHRANFYLLTNAGLFSAFFVAYPELVKYQFLILLIPILGLAIATFWFVTLRGAVKWIQQWREKVMELDKELDRFQCYCRVESYVTKSPFMSPSYVTQFLPLVFFFAWFTVLIFLLISFIL